MLYLKRHIFALALLYYILSTDGRVYRFDYTYYPEIEGWVKMHRIPTVWNEARLRCHAEGAVLMSPINAHLLEVMKHLVAANNSMHCGVYTGIHASFHKGVYTSLEGIPLTKIPVTWASDEPDNFEDSENCLLLTPSGTMADIKCTEVLPYICYKKENKDIAHTPCGTSDKNYYLEPRTNSCYKFHHICQTWHDAYMTCAAEGGHLAIINSPTEALALKELYAKFPKNDIACKYKGSILLGYLDWTENNSWFTIHGETLEEAGYKTWGKNQPDGAKHGTLSQKCGAMFTDGTLDDVWCTVVNFPFFCEKSPHSLLSDV